ncbi:MAG TPA: glycerophosphodiester phosphodiesterase [Acidimicrobiales bacterium]
MTAPRLPSLRQPPIGFAHRGARADAPENTIEAFSLARRLGATGLESDVWLTADGIAVLDHDGVARVKHRRRRITDVERADLSDSIPSLADLYAECGTDFELSLDVKDPAAAAATVAVARAAGGAAPERLWMCHHDWRLVESWRAEFPDVRLVDSTRLRWMKEGPERRAAALANAGIDAVNLHHTDWTGGLTTLFHRFSVLTFGWDAQHRRILEELLDIGIDAVYSDHSDTMMDVLRLLEPGDDTTGYGEPRP